MKTLLAVLVVLVSCSAAQAAGGRYSCRAGQHSVSFDLGRKTLTLDGETDTLVQGVATFWASPGGKKVIVAPSDKPGARIFDVSIEQGRVYSGFVVCKPY